MYRRTRVAEQLGNVYVCHYPHKPIESARNIKRSPVHHRVAAKHASTVKLSLTRFYAVDSQCVMSPFKIYCTALYHIHLAAAELVGRIVEGDCNLSLIVVSISCMGDAFC